MYSEKIDNIMKNLEFFVSIYNMPMRNGVNFKTDLFKSELSEYLNNIGGCANKNYDQVSQEVVLFQEALKEFVNKEDFIDIWNNFTWSERKYLIYFDEDSYSILRSKLTTDEIGLINFEDKINSMKINWDEHFVSILNLPQEFNNSPQNNLQFLKQVKKLKSMGFSDNDLTEFVHVRDNRVEMMPNKLVLLFMRTKEYSEKLSILSDLNVRGMDFSLTYLTNFISSEERKLSDNMNMKLK